MEQLDLRVAAVDEQINRNHSDLLRKETYLCQPAKPRWRPWFPLKTITDVKSMEQNLLNENCRAEVV